MSESRAPVKGMQEVEALMLDHFRKEPFHNLRLIYGPQVAAALPGGTCSDKTLSFVAAAKRSGFDVWLHSGLIGGREIHRLARVRIDARTYFADVGNGWPALKLYPIDEEVMVRCFGMGFRTEISAGRVRVFHAKLAREGLPMEIETRCRPEAEIRAEIERRFTSGIVYPFSSSIRFSMVIGDRFLFLRGPRLEIYSEAGFECMDGIEAHQVPQVIRDYFGFDLQPHIDGNAGGTPGARPVHGFPLP